MRFYVQRKEEKKSRYLNVSQILHRLLYKNLKIIENKFAMQIAFVIIVIFANDGAIKNLDI